MNIETVRVIELRQMLMARRLEASSFGRPDGRTGQRLDEAMARLAAHQYGTCTVCGLEIAERRLRALPFAVRCTRCEDRRDEYVTTVSRGERRSEASC